MTKPTFHVVFVCMGNICRSPTAHGVLRQKLLEHGLAQQVHVDSAGTHDYHAGEPPDARSQRHARKRGYDLSDLRARHLSALDFERADLLLVMDEENLATAKRRCPPALRHKLRLLTEFCRAHRSDSVPDPYSGGAQGFEHVLDLVEDACDGLLDDVRKRLRL
ncbi:MAG: low molecular weight phosphotyrosine protein phosphatase [Rhizobacter sp.]|nr:low molecular weight phosphotyrosine protein phosphatase [Rhizobacter sp.]